MKKNLILFGYLLAFLLAFTSCDDDEINPSDGENSDPVQFVYNAMNQFYFWYQEIPSTIKVEDYTDPIVLVEDMRFRPTDIWTFIVRDNGAIADQIIEGTQNGIIGVSVAYDDEDNLRIVYTLPGSPADEAGIQRSDIIQRLNGVVPNPANQLSFGETPELEILSKDGSVRTLTLNRADITENPVLFTEVKEVEGIKVGYLVFNTFNGLAVEELDKAFTAFNAANVDELVVDLRYNGGGLVSAAQHFASLMVPEQNVGELFVAEQFNDLNSDLNSVLLFEETAQNLAGINRIVFLTTQGTASASELVINGLSPYIDVVVIGQNTSGKYVGASLITFDEYTFAPITFQSANANGDVFIGGFSPNIDANDDITHNFGDLNEEMFGVAIDYLTGKISGARKSAAEIKPLEIYNQETYWNGPAIKDVERLD